MIYFRTVPQTNVLGRVNKSYQGLLPQIHCQLSKWWKHFSMRLGRCKKNCGQNWSDTCCYAKVEHVLFFHVSSLYDLLVARSGISQPSVFCGCPNAWPRSSLCVRTDHNVVLRLERRERWSWGTTGRLHQVRVRATCTKGIKRAIQNWRIGCTSGKGCPTSRKSALRCLLLPSRVAPLVNVTDPWLERKWRKMHDWHMLAQCCKWYS